MTPISRVWVINRAVEVEHGQRVQFPIGRRMAVFKKVEGQTCPIWIPLSARVRMESLENKPKVALLDGDGIFTWMAAQPPLT